MASTPRTAGMASADTPERPIGFWLKRLDSLIEDAFDQLLADAGMSRRQWQALNVVRSGAATDADLAEALRPFLGEDAASRDALVGALRQRGWIAERAGGSYELTTDGQAARNAAGGRVAGLRTLLLEGLSDSDYVETVRVLRTMADNLERAATTRAAVPSRAPVAVLR